MQSTMIYSLSFALFSLIFLHPGPTHNNIARADINWPLYSQQCRDDAGPPYLDDEETFNGSKYHAGSAAYPVLQNGQCANPLKNACESRPSIKTAYLEGPIDCGDKGWYCRIYNDESNGWPNVNLNGDVNFGNCNTTDAFEDAGFDRDGHCHGSNHDSTYYWWIRDHWHRQYNGKVRCCCGWFEGGTQPLYDRRIANRCDYRRLVTSTEDANNCRDANEDHDMGFDDIGCDREKYESSQLNQPIPEDDNVCWEIERFGFTEEGGSVPTKSPSNVSPTTPSPVVSPVTSAPTKSPVALPSPSPTNGEDDEDTNPPTASPVTSAPSPSPVASPISEPPVVSPFTSPPTSSPVTPPISDPPSPTDDGDDDDTCRDSTIKFDVVKPNGQIREKNCEWLRRRSVAYRCREYEGVKENCPKTCTNCCQDTSGKFTLKNGNTKDCEWADKNWESRCRKPPTSQLCPVTCGLCDDE